MHPGRSRHRNPAEIAQPAGLLSGSATARPGACARISAIAMGIVRAIAPIPSPFRSCQTPCRHSERVRTGVASSCPGCDQVAKRRVGAACRNRHPDSTRISGASRAITGPWRACSGALRGYRANARRGRRRRNPPARRQFETSAALLPTPATQPAQEQLRNRQSAQARALRPLPRRCGGAGRG